MKQRRSSGYRVAESENAIIRIPSPSPLGRVVPQLRLRMRQSECSDKSRLNCENAPQLRTHFRSEAVSLAARPLLQADCTFFLAILPAAPDCAAPIPV